MLREHVKLPSGSESVMFRPEEVGGIGRFLERHATKHMYPQEVYSAVLEEVLPKVTRDGLGSEGSEMKCE